MSASLHGRLLAAAALVAVLVGSGGAAYADQVTNDLDTTVDATAEALSLAVGGADGTVTLYVLNQNKQQGDTVVPCNLAGSDTLVVDVVSSDQTVATVSPGQLTIGDCGIDFGVALTVRALKAGTTTVTVTRAPGSNPPGTFDFAPATFTVTVTAPANTAPRVRVAGAEDGAVYELGGYSPDPACIVTDAEDSPGSPISVTPVVDDDRDELGLGQVSASCSYTDAGGLTAHDEVAFTVVDTVAPTMQRLSLLPAPNAAGWNDSPVTATWGCFDAGSDVRAMEVTETTVGEGTDLAVTGTCTDRAGNTTSDTIDGLDVDLTDPVVTIGRSPAANDEGWNDGDVTVTWSCTDALSGVTDPGGSTVLGEGADQSATGTCTDRAGNSASAEVTGVKVDTTAPVITRESRTAPYDDRGWNGGDVTVTWTCTDDGSGPVQSSITRVVSTPGAGQTASGTCTDLAGNATSDTVVGINIDTTSPSIDLSRDPADANVNGWNDSPVEVTWTCTDTGGAGVVDDGGSHVVGEGADQSVRGTCTDHAGNTVSDSVTGIDVDLTEPRIEISRDPATGNAHGWSRAAITVTWTCTDGLSGTTDDGGSVTVSEGADQSVTGTCTDLAGNTSEDEVTDIDVDTTDPVISIGRSPAANAAGWNNGDVTVTWTCTDALSGTIDAGGSTVLVEGADQSAAGTCTDRAGNTAASEVADINVDKTAPLISLGRSPAANAAGWNNGEVTVAWTCTDALSGATDADSSTVLDEGADQSATGTCTDRAGNTASAGVTDVNVDTTAPTVSWIEPIGDGAGFYFGSVPPVPGCAATDTLSGLDGACTVSGYGSGVGEHTLTARAVDRAGNETVRRSTYTVRAWTLNGYYNPVDMNGVWNTVKNGSTVPLKLEAFMGSAEITDVATLGATFTVKGVACPGAGAATDDVELTTTGGTTFRYDASGGQFIQNWQTPKKTGACYEVITTTADGSSLSALFKLK
jgi:hypothetical protein